jgi:hypothetical protein
MAFLNSLGLGNWYMGDRTAEEMQTLNPNEGDLYDLEGGIGVLDVARHEETRSDLPGFLPSALSLIASLSF